MLDDKTVREIARELGIEGGMEYVAKAREMEKQSDEALVGEILKLKKQLEKSNVPRHKQIEMAKSLIPMLDDKQKARLAKLIELIDS